MLRGTRLSVMLVICATSIAARAQFPKFHGASIAVGATGQFSVPITSQNGDVSANPPFGTAGVSTYPVTVDDQEQYTTDSLGFLASFQFHPVAWAGIELNYGYTLYSERYKFDYVNPPAAQVVSVSTDQHEATAAYSFHPKHIPFQPFVNIGGGGIDFLPRGVQASNQWRAAGLLEAGFDLPIKYKHVGFRVEGRSLYYRAPNYNQPAIGDHMWRATVEPSASMFYRF